jgi:hypothetical protein
MKEGERVGMEITMHGFHEKRTYYLVLKAMQKGILA